MPWPVTFNGRTYTSNDFLNSSYVNGLPDLMQDAATHFANGYVGSSTTSLSISTGNKTLTVEPNKLFGIGQPVVIASTASPSTQYMDGRITAWNAGTGSMTVAVAALAGSGTLSAWTVTIGGARLSTTSIPVPINEGGTGSTTTGGALTALGLSAAAQTLVAQTTQALMRTTGLGITAAGDLLLTSSTATIQRTNLGAGATGDALFAAATAAAARATLGSGATGDALFLSSSSSSARSTLAVGENHAAGSASAPSVSFSGDLNTGLFSVSADVLGIAAGGALVVRFDSAGMEVNLGSAAAPSMSFVGDANTGIYSSGADSLSVTVGGAERVRATSAGVNVYDVPFIAPIPFFIEGMHLVQNTTDTANDVDITPGACTSSDNAAMIFNTSTMTKRLDTTWGAGNGGGLLDTGTRAANTWYHIYAIYNPTTRASDFVATTTLSSPILPSGFTKYRRIGSIYSGATNINRDWRQFGRTMMWIVPTIEASTNTLGTTATNFSIAAPSGIDVVAIVNVTMNNASNNSGYVRGLTHIDHVPNHDGGGALANLYYDGGSTWAAANMRIETSSAKIRATSALSNTKFRASTLGYTDTLQVNGLPV